MPSRRLLVFTDADNTLWDTDSIYHAAQLALLDCFEPAGGRIIDESQALMFVRAHDQRLAASHLDGLRYPPALLAQAIANELGHRADDARLIDYAVERYCRMLGATPPLRPGVTAGLSALSDTYGPVTIVTESSVSRCEALLVAHALTEHVRQIVAERKTAALYRDLRGDEPGLMVGDQLDRDILFAHEAGLRTVFFPGSFSPFWLADVKVEPDNVIDSFDALPRIAAKQTPRPHACRK